MVLAALYQLFPPSNPHQDRFADMQQIKLLLQIEATCPHYGSLAPPQCALPIHPHSPTWELGKTLLYHCILPPFGHSWAPVSI